MDENVFSPFNPIGEGIFIKDGYIVLNDGSNKIINFFDEAADAKYNSILRRYLYKERIINNKEVIDNNKEILEQIPFLTKAFTNIEMYKGFNLFMDLQYYHNTFNKNNIYKLDKAIDIYFDFVCRILDSKVLKDTGYKKFTVFVPLYADSWPVQEGSYIWDYKFNINPLSLITRMALKNIVKLKEEFSKYDWLFVGENGYFKLDFNTFNEKDIARFKLSIKTILSKEVIIDDEPAESSKAIAAEIIDRYENSTKVTLNKLTGGSETLSKDEINKKVSDAVVSSNADDKKDALVSAINKAAEDSTDIDQTIEKLDQNANIKKIMIDLADDDNDRSIVKTSVARSSRMTKLNDNFLNSKYKDKTISDIINAPRPTELPKTSLDIDSINKEWEDLKFVNFNKMYNLDSDIMAIMEALSNKSIKVNILSVETNDTSTSEDSVITYTFKCEDELAQRFTLKFDIPKLKNDRFMRLRGNEKTISGQLMLLPALKTDEDTVQLVSNYNKIFISRFGSGTGKSFIIADKLIKTLNKYTGNDITITSGDNTRICSKYELPIDYIDLAKVYSKIEGKKYILYFNQDDIRAKYKDLISDKKGIPIGYDKINKTMIYYNNEVSDSSITFSEFISYWILDNDQIREVFKSTSTSSKYTYSKASILRYEIPVIVLLGYAIGLTKTLDTANIKYEFVEKLERDVKNDISKDTIKFEDGYLIYNVNYASSMLMNGLKECDTANYSFAEVNKRFMWFDFLDQFGGRILSDGLDNYYDWFVDPMTERVCNRYKLPTTYPELLIYANDLLADNKYNKHVDITGNKYRTNEIIAGYLYKIISKSHGEYKSQIKHGRKMAMSIKQSAVIDAILSDPTSSDLSILNPLLEYETSNTVSFKGLSGMNSERAYSLDKRTYDDSMLNLLALSTGFAANVGINRQATIDMNIEGPDGYIKGNNTKDDFSVTKTLSMSEALTPFGTTSDDPIRSAMTFIQTTKHGMRTKKSMAQLITTGADEALPYLTSDTFAFKAKNDGKVSEATNDYIIITYKDGSKEFIDLRERVMKNSDGGFFITIKLVPEKTYKEGTRITKDEIIAHDPYSFSNKNGSSDNLAYNIGTFAKVAIMTTDEGYEDSTKVSYWLSDAMSSEVIVEDSRIIPKNSVVYYIAKSGQPIQEGEPLLIFQHAFDEEDINSLLKNIKDDDSVELISELGKITIKSKVTGIVQDIKSFRTVELEELSDSLKKVVNNIDAPINNLRKIMKRNGITDTTVIEPTEKLEATGKLKNARDSVMISFYLKYDDKLGVGDKLVAKNAAKGTIKGLFPEGEEPTSEFRPKEPIHALFATGSFDARMVGSVIKDVPLHKGLVELDRFIKNYLGIPIKYIEDIE